MNSTKTIAIFIWRSLALLSVRNTQGGCTIGSFGTWHPQPSNSRQNFATTGTRKMNHMNFINKDGRTYLVKNPNSLGEGKNVGYYREALSGGFKVIRLEPYTEESFATAEECQAWLMAGAGE
jgi:hypothetical protein